MNSIQMCVELSVTRNRTRFISTLFYIYCIVPNVEKCSLSKQQTCHDILLLPTDASKIRICDLCLEVTEGPVEFARLTTKNLLFLKISAEFWQDIKENNAIAVAKCVASNMITINADGP